MSGIAPPFRTLELSDPAIDPRGLRFATVKSAALGQRADVTLWLPPGAETQREGEGLLPLPDLLAVHINFLRGKVRLLLANAPACQHPAS